jgi:kynureninase
MIWAKKEVRMNLSNYDPGETFARKLDEQDVLARYRQDFYINDPDLIYLDGNSLGRLPVASRDRICSMVEAEWGIDLIRGWNTNWYQAPTRVGEKIARLVGAAPGQVLVSDSTSVNLFKLACAALALRPERACIVSDTLNFPSDVYILQGIIPLLGNRHNLMLVPSIDGISIDLEDFAFFVDEYTALLTVSQVVFKSGFLYDVEKLTQIAHRAGALVLLDLSHSVGAVPIELDRWGVDLAVGCTYKCFDLAGRVLRHFCM